MRTMDLLIDTQMLLDEAACLLREWQIKDAFRLLRLPLAEFRDAALRHGVHERFVQAVRAHELQNHALEDPFTHRAFHKPRGYPGDAVTLDLIFDNRAPEGTTDLGRNIFALNTRSPTALSVMYRRGVFRAYIDDTVARNESCRILAVAAGHCRELAGSLALEEGSGAEFVAVDHDQWSCRTLARAYTDAPVKVAAMKMPELIENGCRLGQFDLIYSPGLFDYLTTPLARRLVRKLSSQVRPGGRLVFANFTPHCEGRGYMDAIMDWPLVYRDTGELLSMFTNGAARNVRTFLDPHGNVGYAESHVEH